MKATNTLFWLLTMFVVVVVTASLSSEGRFIRDLHFVRTAEAGGQKASQLPHDAVAAAQEARDVPIMRPEQKLTEHDRSGLFGGQKASASSPAFQSQLRAGKAGGFDFYRDPLGAEKPLQEPEEILKQDMANKPAVMETQRKLLERRYHLRPKLDPAAKMSRGKPLPVGPTARLPEGITWDRLAEMSPEKIKQQGLFPFPSLPG